MQSPQPSVGQPAPDTSTSSRLRIAPGSIVVFCVVFWAIPLVGLLIGQYIDILLVVFLAVLLSTSLSPAVDALERRRIGRGMGVLLIYLLAAAVVAAVALLALPLFTGETGRLAQTLPADLRAFAGPLRLLGITVRPDVAGHVTLRDVNILSFLTGGAHGTSAVASQAIGLAFSVGQALVFLLSILVMSFLLTVRRTFAADVVGALVPPDYRRRTVYILSHIGERMGRWVLGQLAITVYYAAAFSVGLTLLGAPYAFSVAVITGLLEIVPFVGGFVGLLLAILVATTMGPGTIVWVLALYLVVTGVEAQVLAPLVYGRAVHVHPFLVIVALLVGAKAFGLLGALIAVPMAAAIQVVVENLYIKDIVEAAEHKAGGRSKRTAIPLSALRRLRQD